MTSTRNDSDGSSSDHVWCFQCGNEYEADVAECTECGVPTTTDVPRDIGDIGGVDDDQLAYEFHEWTGQGRSTLDGMLTRSGIDHAWQGATLIIKEADEEAVDEAVAQAEITAMPTLDLSQPTMIYELAELDDEQHGRLLRRMGDDGLPHAFDANGDLFVYEKDEDAVDELFANLDEADVSEREFGPGLPGVDPVEVMSDLFVAAGRLRKNAGERKAIIAMIETASLVNQMTLPYGLGADVWADVVDQSSALSDAIVEISSGVETDDDIEEMAGALHDVMRRLV